ncbi:MAG: disulfide bond formation protein B [Bauldia sp.]
MLSRREYPAAFVFIIGLATILGAWGFQIVGGYVPCKLCLEERWPYYIGVPLALVALVAQRMGAPAWVPRVLLGLAAIVFAYGAWLGTYHAGAEWAWWPGPTDCGGGSAGASGTDLLNQLKNIHVVSCTDASFRFPGNWGLSFAGWNAVVSAVLVVVAAIGAGRK